MVEEWQIALSSIGGFVAACGGLFVVNKVMFGSFKDKIRTEYYTKEEADKMINKLQTQESCGLYHQAQEIRNGAFTSALNEIKEEIKELKADIREAIDYLIKNKSKGKGGV